MTPDAVLRDILTRLQRLERPQVKHRMGVITDTNPLSVALGGSTPFTGVQSLSPDLQVDDIVSVLTFGSDLIVQGRIPADLTDDRGPAACAFQAQVTNTPTATFGAHTVFGGSGSSPAVTWSEAFDISSVFDPTTGRFTPNIKGVYEFYATIYWSLFTADQTQVITDLFKNGSLAQRGQIGRSSGTGDQSPSTLKCMAVANGTTDFFQLGYFNAGSTGTPNGNGAVYWGARLVGRQT